MILTAIIASILTTGFSGELIGSNQHINAEELWGGELEFTKGLSERIGFVKQRRMFSGKEYRAGKKELFLNQDKVRPEKKFDIRAHRAVRKAT